MHHRRGRIHQQIDTERRRIDTLWHTEEDNASKWLQFSTDQEIEVIKWLKRNSEFSLRVGDKLRDRILLAPIGAVNIVGAPDVDFVETGDYTLLMPATHLYDFLMPHCRLAKEDRNTYDVENVLAFVLIVMELSRTDWKHKQKLVYMWEAEFLPYFKRTGGGKTLEVDKAAELMRTARLPPFSTGLWNRVGDSFQGERFVL